MSQNPWNPGSSQHHAQNQPQIPILIPAPNTVQGQLQAQNEHLDAQAAVLLNEFLAKTRRLVASELGNDMNCTICSEAFLRGENPEVPVRLDCGHIFGMNCILKWLSPVSRNGNNSCPNCRKPIFADWDKMDFPVPRRVAPARRRVTAAPIRAPAASPHVNNESTRAPPATVSAADTPRDQRRGPPYSPWAAPLPAGFPRVIRSRSVTLTATTPDLVDATATTSSDAATPEPVAPNTPLTPPVVATPEASDQQQAVQGPQTAATSESRTSEISTPDDTTSSLSSLIQRRGRRAAPTISRREWENAIASWLRPEDARTRARSARSRQINRQMERESERQAELLSLAQEAAHRPAAAATPAPAEAARSTEDEDNGVAAMFDAAELEHSRQRQQEATNERKRYMWMQFCEGVVRTIEQSNDSTAFTNHDLALTIINMKDLDEFVTERASESPTWRRILQTFPRLHTEMVTRFNDFRPLPSVNIDNRMELERLLASTSFNMETLHKARWYTRLSERLARVAATSNHEAAVARLTERVANLSGPSRENTASATNSSEQPTPEEARGRQRMEDYLLGRTPIIVSREAAESVNAALRAGAASSSAMATVTRL